MIVVLMIVVLCIVTIMIAMAAPLSRAPTSHAIAWCIAMVAAIAGIVAVVIGGFS